MKTLVKFANKDVNIKKLVQGAVVMEIQDNGEYEIFHINKFMCFHQNNSSIDLIVADDWGKRVKNSADLTWPI
jgi:hypothetical protein